MPTPPLDRRLTLHQLRLFREVVDRGSFTVAARALSLSQPAVTHQLQALARAVGQPLLERGRGVHLTAVGRALYDRAQQILDLVDETAGEIDDIADARTGDVCIAGDTTVGNHVLPDALAAFHREHPAVRVTLKVENRARVRELLLEGAAELGVVGRLWDDDLLEAEPFLENTLVCVSAPTHPFVGREPVRPADLSDGPLLLRERGSGTRASAEELLREQGVEAMDCIEMASNGAIKRAVAGGLGVTIISAYAVGLELSMGLLRPLAVEGLPVQSTWHVVWPRERRLSPTAGALRSFLGLPDWRGSLEAPRATD